MDSVDNSPTTLLKVVAANESAVRLEKKALVASGALSAKIETDLVETLKKKVVVSVKF